VALLKQVKGVGTLIALTYVLTRKTRGASERVEMQAAMWDCNRADGTPTNPEWLQTAENGMIVAAMRYSSGAHISSKCLR
jgi:hypothetical protein